MPKQYTTILGDMWDLIAFKTLGSEMYTHLLIESNLKYKDVVVFSAGVVLTVPDIETPAASGLPPWKKGGVSK
ncbi:MAG: phage tail protein [Ruminococcus sp.]|nr:phage tail protein [Ruminococcus sp.]